MLYLLEIVIVLIFNFFYLYLLFKLKNETRKEIKLIVCNYVSFIVHKDVLSSQKKHCYSPLPTKYL